MTRLPPISSLLTPPELGRLSEDFDSPRGHSTDSFSATATYTMGATKQSPELQRALQPISPPISPQVALQAPADVDSSQSSQQIVAADPLLFPENSERETPTSAFFPHSQEAENLIRQTIRQHVARRDAQRLMPSKSGDPRHKRKPSMPTTDEYYSFTRGVIELKHLPRKYSSGYLKAVVADNEEQYRMTEGIRRKKLATAPVEASVKVSAPVKAPKMSRTGSSGKIQKPSAPKRADGRRSVKPSALKTVRNATPDERAPPKKKTEDIAFDALPDLSPPTALLDGKAFKISERVQNRLDLSQDPHRGLLHELEIDLAEELRLSCATYLCTKRRIFIARVQKMAIGKEFRKTDAQQACKIDVNKASKMWTAYDSVGWLDLEHFTQHQGKTFDI